MFLLSCIYSNSLNSLKKKVCGNKVNVLFSIIIQKPWIFLVLVKKIYFAKLTAPIFLGKSKEL